MSRISNRRSIIAVANPPPIPSGQDTQILTNVNGANQYSYPGYNFSGGDMFPENTIDLSGFSYFDNSPNKFRGGVLGPNGKIYCIPYESTYVGIIDPISKTVDITSITGITGGGKFIGGVVAPNGNIYCIPFNASYVLIINPFSNTTSRIDGITVANYPQLVRNDQKFTNGVLYENKIYCTPYYTQCVMIIDTITNTVNTTDISGINNTNYPSINRAENNELFYSGCLAPNGRIYMIPVSSSTVMQINPLTNAVDLSSLQFTTFGIPSSTSRFKYFGAALAPDNNIYACPWGLGPAGYNRILKIDTSNNSLSTIDISGGPSRYYGTICSTNGRLYGIPFDSSNVLIFNPINSTANITTITDITGTSKYAGAVLGPNGIIYAIPSNNPSIMTIKTGIPTLPTWMMAPEFNKL